MMRLYMIPMERNTTNNAKGPKYFEWRFDPDPPGIQANYSIMDFGFEDCGLILSPNILDTDHEALILNSDVYWFEQFPDNMGIAISPSDNLDVFFENLNIPTDWTTAATTYLEFLRQLAGMLQFNQRFNGISAGHSLFENGVTLSMRVRQLSAEAEAWFNDAVDWFCTRFNIPFDSSQINRNDQLRKLLKQAGSFWENRPFYLHGVEF